jgi:hypothetical protein
MTLECIRLGTGRVTLQTITQQNAGGDTMIGEFAKQTIMENYIVQNTVFTISSPILFFSFRHEVCTSVGELKGGLESPHNYPHHRILFKH